MNMKTPPTSPPAGDAKKYRVKLTMVPPHSPHDTNMSQDAVPWAVVVLLKGIDLAFLRTGLFWTTQNLVLLSGHLVSLHTTAAAQTKPPWAQDLVRMWSLREFPGRPEDESRWVGSVTLLADSAQTLAGFRLGQLTRQLICSASVVDGAGNEVFYFHAEEPAGNRNDLFDGSACDLWWLWPMESVVPEGEGGGWEGKTGAGGCVAGGLKSCLDAVAPMCAGLAGGILVVASGIFVLLSAWSTVLLEFGRGKEEGDTECRVAGHQRSSRWKEAVVGLFTWLTDRLQGVGWWNFILGTVAGLWGVGGFVLVATSEGHGQWSWKEAVVWLFTWFTERFRGVSWWEFVGGTVFGLWGIGSFVLFAIGVLSEHRVADDEDSWKDVATWMCTWLRHGLQKVGWWNSILGTVFGLWGIGGFVLVATSGGHDQWSWKDVVVWMFNCIQHGLQGVGWAEFLLGITLMPVISIWGIGGFVLVAISELRRPQ